MLKIIFCKINEGFEIISYNSGIVFCNVLLNRKNQSQNVHFSKIQEIMT